jgi:hypothetical protein
MQHDTCWQVLLLAPAAFRNQQGVSSILTIPGSIPSLSTNSSSTLSR